MRITGAPRRGIAARPARVPVLVLLAGTLLLLASLALLSARPARSASTSSTVVSATVPSATSLDISGCAADVSDVTDFGIVTPGSFSRTGTDCVVTFGSSNDAARLLTFQGDGAGDAMAAATSGGWDMDFDGNSGTGDGQVTDTDPGTVGGYFDAQMAVDPRDGSIFTTRQMPPGGDDLMRVAKYTPTGVLDVNWDGPSGTGDGIVDYDTIGPFLADDVQSIHVQPDGKVLLGLHGGSGFVVVRLTTTGDLDSTFASGGIANLPTGAGDGDIQDVTIDSRGRIYAAGFRDTPTDQMLVFRLTVDGRLDTTFGSGGIATTGALLTVPIAYKVIIQPDGKVLLAGREWGGSQDVAFARFSSSGVLDTTLDGDGTTIVQATPGVNNFAWDAGYSDDGYITAVGSSGTGAGVIVRIDASTGLPDLNFDGPTGTGDGIVLISPGGATTTELTSVIVDPDGYITFAGSVDSGETNSFFGRMTSTGQWDTSFDGPSGSGDGWFTVNTAPGDYDAVYDLQRATDGDIVAFVVEGASATARILRFDSTTIPDYAVGADDWTPGDSAFGMCLASLTGTGASITAAWTPDARCTNMGDSTNGTWWDDVPDNSGSPDAQVGSLSSTATDGSAHFRFGLRVAPNTPPGRYLAPITFQVVAP